MGYSCTPIVVDDRTLRYIYGYGTLRNIANKRITAAVQIRLCLDKELPI